MDVDCEFDFQVEVSSFSSSSSKNLNFFFVTDIFFDHSSSGNSGLTVILLYCYTLKRKMWAQRLSQDELHDAEYAISKVRSWLDECKSKGWKDAFSWRKSKGESSFDAQVDKQTFSNLLVNSFQMKISKRYIDLIWDALRDNDGLMSLERFRRTLESGSINHQPQSKHIKKEFLRFVQTRARRRNHYDFYAVFRDHIVRNPHDQVVDYARVLEIVTSLVQETTNARKLFREMDKQRCGLVSYECFSKWAKTLVDFSPTRLA